MNCECERMDGVKI